MIHRVRIAVGRSFTQFVEQHRRRGGRRNGALALGCIAAMALAAWGFAEGNHCRYGRWAVHWLGPPPNPPRGSAPPWLEFDLAGMALCAFVFGVAAVVCIGVLVGELCARRAA